MGSTGGQISSSDISFLTGPNGETVVVTPPKQRNFEELHPTPEPKGNDCGLYWNTWGVIFIIFGLPFFGIGLGAEGVLFMLYIGLALIIPGVISICIGIAYCRGDNDRHHRRIVRYMHLYENESF